MMVSGCGGGGGGGGSGAVVPPFGMFVFMTVLKVAEENLILWILLAVIRREGMSFI